MIAFIQSLSTKPKYEKALKWSKLVTITGGGNAIVQIIGLISGILVIRVLPTKEYALYTLANTMLGTMTVLADGGIGRGVMSLGGKVWQNPKTFGAVLVTGFALRKKFAIGSFLLAIPVLIILLRHNHASWLVSFLIVIALIPAFFTALSGTLLQIPSQLRQDITPLQKNQIGINFGRLIMLLSLFIFPWAFIAILSSSIPQIWGNIKLRKISGNYADWTQNSDATVQKEILSFVKRLLPGAIYFCVSGQITIWLISIFGTTTGIAQVGALGRLTMVLSFITSLYGTLVIPRFARLSENKKLILSQFFKVQLSLIVLMTTIVGFVILFPLPVLSVLGKAYNNLSIEIAMMTAGGCISMLSGITYSLSVSRGFILPPIVHIGVNLITQIVLIYILDLSSIQNILLFTIVSSLIAYVMTLTYFILRSLHLVNV